MNQENSEPNPSLPIMVLGEALTDLPQDLYIPPHALELFLESFTGPLDLLLYLIKKENINILDIPIAAVTVQYIKYIELMESLQLELAADYLVMAAVLAEIKSRMLLPSVTAANVEEADPRAELVRKLREYEQYKKAAEDLDNLPRVEREIFPVTVFVEFPEPLAKPLPNLRLGELIQAWQGILTRAKMYMHHLVRQEPLSIRERMIQILSTLQSTEFISFEKMFTIKEGRLGVVVTFMAILELLRQNSIEIVQAEVYGSIYLKTVARIEN